MAKPTTRGKFKTLEKNAKKSPVKDIEWEGEEVGVVSDTKIEQDTGSGQEVLLRFFEFAVNPEDFKNHKPTGQELFNNHRRGIEALLWTDGWQPFPEVEPRLQFTKDKTKYRFIIGCVPSKGNLVLDKTRTLSELLIK